MGYSNGRIFAPVNSDDVVAVVHVNSHNWKDQCTSPLINMWAKYKPERIGGPEDITLAQRKANNFGLRPGATYDSKLALINAVANGTFVPGWVYDRPTATDWHRIDDFIGYNHAAVCPFGELLPFTGFLYDDTFQQLIIPCSAPQWSVDGGDDEGNLNISDFDQYLPGTDVILANCYLGILLYSASKQLMATTTAPIGANQDWQVNFGWISPSYAGTYRGIPFLSKTPYAVGGAEQTGARILGLNSAGANVELKTYSSQVMIVLVVSYANESTTIADYDISIINSTGSAKTFNNLGIYVARDDSGTNAYRLVSFGNVTVGAGQTWNRVGSANAGYGYGYFEWFRAVYTGGYTDWEPMPAPEFGDGGDDGPDPGDWG